MVMAGAASSRRSPYRSSRSVTSGIECHPQCSAQLGQTPRLVLFAVVRPIPRRSATSVSVQPNEWTRSTIVRCRSDNCASAGQRAGSTSNECSTRASGNTGGLRRYFLARLCPTRRGAGGTPTCSETPRTVPSTSTPPQWLVPWSPKQTRHAATTATGNASIRPNRHLGARPRLLLAAVRVSSNGAVPTTASRWVPRRRVRR